MFQQHVFQFQLRPQISSLSYFSPPEVYLNLVLFKNKFRTDWEFKKFPLSVVAY